MENWQFALVLIGAVLVGAVIPLIFQARSTLKAWERIARENEADLRAVLRDAANLSSQIKKVSSSMRTASMVGAAVAPVVQAAINGFNHKQVERVDLSEHEIQHDIQH
jgi:hypothetical protein